MTYEISYAYPSSPNAVKLGRNREGCYVLDQDGKKTAHATLADAKTAAVGEPGRWSMDHPKNQHFEQKLIPIPIPIPA